MAARGSLLVSGRCCGASAGDRPGSFGPAAVLTTLSGASLEPLVTGSTLTPTAGALNASGSLSRSWEAEMVDRPGGSLTASAREPFTAATWSALDTGTPQRNDRTGPSAGLATAATLRIGEADPRRGCVRTARPAGSNATVTDPSTSVRYTRAPVAANRSSVRRAGWPYGLPVPADATAIFGRTAARKASVVAVLLPWWATLSRSTGGSPSANNDGSTSCSTSPASRKRR